MDSNYYSIPEMVLLYQLELVDGLTLVQFSINVAAQWAGIAVGEATGDMSDLGSSVLLAPVLGQK
jgi:hypothetical protein